MARWDKAGLSAYGRDMSNDTETVEPATEPLLEPHDADRPPSTNVLARLGRTMMQQNTREWRTVVRSLVHVSALGVLGTAVIVGVIILTLIGIITIPLAGIGLALLVVALYVVFVLASFEIERTWVLYGIDVPRLVRVKGEGEGIAPFLKMEGLQALDLRMWRSFLSLGVSSLLGVAFLFIVWVDLQAVGTVVTHLFSSVVYFPFLGTLYTWQAIALTVIFLMISVPTVVGIGLLQGVVVRNLAVLPSRDSLNKEVEVRSVQREGAVRAAGLERTRIERDLHDGVQPRLVSIAISLGMAQKKIESDPKAAEQLVAEAHVSIKAAITELRQLARGIHPSVLDDRGLDAALSALAGQSHIPVTLDVRMDGREALLETEDFAAGLRDAEAAAYFAIAESLTNAAKHSRASECRVLVRLRDTDSTEPVLWARVEDNGVGGAEILPGGGLDGIRNRILAAGGSSSFASPVGGPTALEVSVPCVS